MGIINGKTETIDNKIMDGPSDLITRARTVGMRLQGVLSIIKMLSSIIVK